MKSLNGFVFGIIAGLLFFHQSAAVAQGPSATTFTYQGKLQNAAVPASGQYDFIFRLYDASSNGSQVGADVNLDGVTVQDGLFSVPLDFGSVFSAGQRWIDISVRTHGGGGYTHLAPRQPVTPAPTAITALNGVPAGMSILGDSATPPDGFTWTGKTIGEKPAVWTQKSNVPMPSIQPAEGDALNGKFYLIFPEYTAAYDPTTDAWTDLHTTMSTPRIFTFVAAVNNKIYVIGGQTVGPQATTSENEAYDPATNSWSSVAPMPIASFGGAACVVNGLIYCIDDNNTQIYNPTTDSWTSGITAPIALGVNFAAAVVDGKIYVFGGGASAYAVYDPSAGAGSAWSPITPLSEGAVEFAAAAVLDGKIHLMGGFKGSGANLQVYQNDWIYDPASNNWTAGPLLVNARIASAAAVIGSHIYLTGGVFLTSGGDAVQISTTEKYSGSMPGFYVHVKL